MSTLITPPFYPIIYVRGYAMTQSEVEDTVATPYMGFNLGSTKVRQRWDRSIESVIFESPLVRLMKEYEYRDAYHDGHTLLLDPDPPKVRGGRPRPAEPPVIPPRSVLVYRYYDLDSKDLNREAATRRSIEDQANGLSRMILQLREQVCRKRVGETWVKDADAERDFRVYLVAHSMGGLIVRCLLQNPAIGSAAVKAMVDKVFTYATPHGGIGLGPFGTVPSFITANNMDNFNTGRMAKYLALGNTKTVNTLDGRFDPNRFFCLVGTNYRDYTVGRGVSSALAGAMSDGLVRIDSAAVQGAPRAFVHRSHSGHYGIVNSEEGYQNLVRFLFGSVRVDGELAVRKLTLPPKIQDRKDRKNEDVRGSYHFDVIATVRGAMWDLHRRVQDEGSAVFAEYDQLVPKQGKPREPHLFSLFMSRGARQQQLVDERFDPRVDDVEGMVSLGFSLMLRIHVPLFEVGGSLFFRERFPNATIYEDTLQLTAVTAGRLKEAIPTYLRMKERREPTDAEIAAEVTRNIPPGTRDDASRLRCVFSSGRAPELVQWAAPKEGRLVYEIPIEKAEAPGIEATLRLTATDWN